MPNRIIKESICASENIDRLNPFHETFFYRLIVNCDDYGRMDARPKILASRLFPLRDLESHEVIGALNALRDADLILIYEVEGKPYLQMRTWDKHQQVRAKRSKYPSPESIIPTSDNICNQLISDDSKCPRNPIQSNPNPNPNPYPNPMLEDDEAVKIQKDHNRILDAAQDAGFKSSPAERAGLLNLYAVHGLDKMISGIGECVKHSAPNLAYLEAVLKGTGKKPDNRSYAGAENEAHDRLLRMSGIDPKTGKKMDATDIHGYSQRDYSNEQAEAIKRMMSDEWGEAK